MQKKPNLTTKLLKYYVIDIFTKVKELLSVIQLAFFSKQFIVVGRLFICNHDNYHIVFCA